MTVYLVRVRLTVNDPILYGIESLEQELALFNEANAPKCKAEMEGYTEIETVSETEALIDRG